MKKTTKQKATEALEKVAARKTKMETELAAGTRFYSMASLSTVKNKFWDMLEAFEDEHYKTVVRRAGKL